MASYAIEAADKAGLARDQLQVVDGAAARLPVGNQTQNAVVCTLVCLRCFSTTLGHEHMQCMVISFVVSTARLSRSFSTRYKIVVFTLPEFGGFSATATCNVEQLLAVLMRCRLFIILECLFWLVIRYLFAPV